MTDADGPVAEEADAGAARVKRPKRRWLRRVLVVAACLSLLVVGYFTVTYFQVVSAARIDDAADPDAVPAEAIVVLGAAQYDGVPSPVLRARLDHAVELYQRGMGWVIVVTGGRQPGDRFTEATAGADYLVAHGIPDSAIRREVHGRTTFESLRASSTFLNDEGIHDVFLVSDGYHSKRALAIADEVGLDARVSPSDTSLRGMARFRAELRETVAVGVARFTGYRLLDHR